MNNLFIAENLKVMTKVLPILKIQVHRKEVSLIVKRDHLIPVLTFLKNHIKYQFKILSCISGVDYPSQKYRFKVVYELLSVRYNTRIRVKVLTDELTPVESCCKIFPAAGWYESETWDMYGIFFSNHVRMTIGRTLSPTTLILQTPTGVQLGGRIWTLPITSGRRTGLRVPALTSAMATRKVPSI